MSAEEERDSEEAKLSKLNGLDGLADLPADLEGPGERDEMQGWGPHNSGDMTPAADLLAQRLGRVGNPSSVVNIGSAVTSSGSPAQQRLVRHVDPIPVFPLFPKDAQPWTVDSDTQPRQSFYQTDPWTLIIQNQSGYDSVLEKILWRLLPLTDDIQHSDVRLSAKLKGASVLGLQRLPVGQLAESLTQLRIPTDASLTIFVEALKRPVLQGATGYTGPAVFGSGIAALGKKIWLFGGVNTTAGTYDTSAWYSGDGGATWQEAPQPPWVQAGAAGTAFDFASAVTMGGRIYVLSLTGASDTQIWSMSNGNDWALEVDDTTLLPGIPAGDFIFNLSQNMCLLDGELCFPYVPSVGNSNVFLSADGKDWRSTWPAPGGPVIPWGVAIAGANGTGAPALEFGGRLVVFSGISTNQPATAKLQLAWSADKGVTWNVVTTPIPGANSPGTRGYVQGDRLWLTNIKDPVSLLVTTNSWWSDDLLNWHGPYPSPWGARERHALFASEDAVVAFGGSSSLNFAPYTLYSDFWSGGTLAQFANLSLAPSLRLSGVYIPTD